MHGSYNNANWKPGEMAPETQVMSKATGEIHECKASQNVSLLRKRRGRIKGTVLSCRHDITQITCEEGVG